MAQKHVVAFFMHEHEAAEANRRMQHVVETESFLIGDIDEDEIPDLQRAGLIVQVVEDSAPEPLDELVAGFHRTAIAPAALDRAEERSVAETNYFTAELAGPLVEPWRELLAAFGAEIIEVTGPQRFTIRIELGTYGDILNLGFVRRLRPYTIANAEPQTARRLDIGAAPNFREMVAYDLRLHRADDADRILEWLVDRHIAVGGRSRRKLRVYLFRDAAELSELERLPEIASVEEFVPPQLANDRARHIIGLDTNLGLGGVAETGHGQIVAIADTGLDDMHPDFQGRIVGLVALGRPNDPSDPNGHGTHVAGSVAGDGAASNGAIRGTAPGAKIFFQSIMDASGRLGGLPLDLNDLFDEAYRAGARIHNNSWGAALAARYSLSSLEVDEFVHDHPDMTVVIAAGNEGTAGKRINSATGYVDWLSLNAPSTSKNALTVGASRSDRVQGGFAGLTWGQAWPNHFPDPPISTETVSGDPESLAAFSSRGPCDDRRIKPDLVAPGTDIVSAKSSRAPLANFWGSFPGYNSQYAYMGGTSMAAPLVAGCAALVREYFERSHDHDASAALVKAALINGTRWLSGNDATAEFATTPNFHQGFGRLHMPWTIPNPGENGLELRFIDGWQDAQLQLFRTGARIQRRVRVGDSRPFRACLVWTDPPGRALQNNLDLFIEHLPTATKWMGNQDLPLRLRLPDAENNIEIVRIETPVAGDYLIQIAASNLLRTDGQAFALVVTGDLSGELVPF